MTSAIKHFKVYKFCIERKKNIGQLQGKMANRKRDCPGLASGSTKMMLCVHILGISLPLGHFWTTTMGISNSNDTSKGSTGQEGTEGSCWFRNTYRQDPL